MAIAMIRQKTELYQWLRIYIQKNMSSIIYTSLFTQSVATTTNIG